MAVSGSLKSIVRGRSSQKRLVSGGWSTSSEDAGEIIAWERCKLRFVSREETGPNVAMEEDSGDEQAVEEEQDRVGVEPELPGAAED
eukprot:6179640-Pleurochrysis_carterae.AAC.1